MGIVCEVGKPMICGARSLVRQQEVLWNCKRVGAA